MHTSVSRFRNERSVQEVTFECNAFLSLECSRLKLVSKSDGKKRVWGFKSTRVGEASHPGPVMSKLATINVDGLDEMTWFVVREWMLEVGVDALAVQEHKLLLSGGGP